MSGSEMLFKVEMPDGVEIEFSMVQTGGGNVPDFTVKKGTIKLARIFGLIEYFKGLEQVLQSVVMGMELKPDVSLLGTDSVGGSASAGSSGVDDTSGSVMEDTIESGKKE